ncbi:MAG: hypothetical protein OEW35_06550 [Gammaproteobacteria bacterium]|nr:hypothetical protein [Gammaproteobacteria bacterium]MDH4253552.1 hypothetical protein [Gammaproteobacteria bacterium]MDH5310108.1 hypothetical protein [Gammaproteobacteria bacterium]
MFTTQPRNRRATTVARIVLFCLPAALAVEARAADPMHAEDVRIGIPGTESEDTISVLSPLEVLAFAEGLGIDLPIFGSGDFDGAVTAKAAATGVNVFGADDTVAVLAPVVTNATAQAFGGSAQGSVSGSSSADISVGADAEADAVDAGDGDDTLVTTAAMSSQATAQAFAAAASLTADGELLSNAAPGDALLAAGTDASAAATALNGGAGIDRIDNTGDLTILANASSLAITGGVAIAVGSDGNVAAGSALSDGSSVAFATATGIEGGDGSDSISNRGQLGVVSSAGATGVSFGLNVAGSVSGDVEPGASLNDFRTGAESSGMAVSGGDGDDDIVNIGRIGVSSTSQATAVSASLSLGVSKEGSLTTGGTVSDAGAAATSTATGVDGGDGNDTIFTLAATSPGIEAWANAGATGVAASLDFAGSVTGGVDAGDALSIAGADTDARAIGVSAGGGGDEITNLAGINLLSTSSATAVGVGLSASLNMGGDVTAGGAVSEARTRSAAESTGVSGGAGDDRIDNAGDLATINAVSSATSTAVAVGLSVSGRVATEETGAGGGDVSSTAVSDSSAVAAARSAGLAGDEGLDRIHNAAGIASFADATGTAVDVSASLAANVGIDVAPEGAVSGAALSDASVGAHATATGIDGGADADTIANEGAVTAQSSASSVGVSVSLGIAGKVAYQGEQQDDGQEPQPAQGAADGAITGQAFSDTRSDAYAETSAIGGGDGADTMDNTGALSALAMSDATSVAVSVSQKFNAGLKVEPEGDVTGAALADAGVAARSSASGLDGGDGNDDIDNTGTASVASVSTATGVAVSLSVAGNLTYKAESDEQQDGGDTAPDSVESRAMTGAATEASAVAAGVSAGSGDDDVTNGGVLSSIIASSGATGVAASVSLAAGVGIDSDASVDVTGAAASDTSVSADSLAVGIDGGEGADLLTNSSELPLVYSNASATGVAAALSVSGSLAYKGDTSGSISGSSLSDSSTNAAASAIAIGGGDGADTITNSGSLGTIHAGSTATGVAAALGISGGLAINGDAENVEVSGKSVSDASVTATADAVALDGGGGGDIIRNSADIGRVEALSNALGVAASVDIAGSFSYKGNTDSSVSGQAVSDTSVTSQASAAGIRAGADDDYIENSGNLESVYAKADATGVAAAVSAAVAVTVKGDSKADIEGQALSKGSVLAAADALGIGAGDGDDEIANTADTLHIKSESDAIGVAVGVGVAASVTVTGNSEADVSGAALSDTSARSVSISTGVSGGAGDDIIGNGEIIVDEDGEVVGNNGDMTVLAESDATGIAASVEVAAAVTFKGTQQADVKGQAASDASVTAQSHATGIDGGSGLDTLTNAGNISLMTQDVVDADALGVAAALTVSGNLAIKGVATGETEGAAASRAAVTAEAVATGLDGGDDRDVITNSGTITALPAAKAKGISASLTVAGGMSGETNGAAMSESDVTASASAVGIDGGSGNDDIFNTGAIDLLRQGVNQDETDAYALGIAATLNVSGTIAGDAGGEALASANTIATAAATGIAGGDGSDYLVNSAPITADVDADANAVGVAASVTLSGTGSASGAAIAEARADSSAAAQGVAGGAGDDELVNTGSIALVSDADADATSVSVSLAVAARGVAESRSMADGSATATARTVGLDGGAGEDTVTASTGGIFTGALSSATATSVSVSGAGSIGVGTNEAVADSSALGVSYAAGIDGGDDADTITNASLVNAVSAAAAKATSTTVTVSFGVGASDSISLGDSSATASAIAAGIEGSGGDDTITNEAQIFAGRIGADPMATAEAGSTTVSVGISAGYSESAASSNSAALAEASAFGLSGGAGDDHIVNSGILNAGVAGDIDAASGPLAEARARTRTVDVGLAVGSSIRSASADSSANAVSNVAGIAGGDGSDFVENTGLVNAYSGAQATASSTTTSVSLTLGASEGSAEASAASRATAIASGIDGGAGDDVLNNSSDLNVRSDSLAWSSSSSLNLNIASLGTASQTAAANSSSTAESFARGIYGGEGKETIDATGLFSVEASSNVYSRARASTVTGLSAGQNDQHAQSRAETTAASLAIGIDGGLGDDTIGAGAILDLTSTAHADSSGVSSTNSGLNIAGSSSGEAYSDARATVLAEAIGMRGGDAELAAGQTDADTITVRAPIAMSAVASGSSSSSASADVLAVFGSTQGTSVADASATVLARSIGIDGGADADIVSTVLDEATGMGGDLDVTAAAAASVVSVSTANGDVGFGSASTMGVSDASARIEAEALGIDGGSGDDTIRLGRPVSAKAITSGNVQATSTANADAAFGDASSATVSDASVDITAVATGILAGAGADGVFIDSSAEVTALSNGNVTSTSNSNAASTFFGDASSGAVSDASARRHVAALGVDGGSGDDTIEVGPDGRLVARVSSNGSVTSIAHANADAGWFGDASATTASAAASEGAANTLAITGGDGNDHIINRGTVAADAGAVLTVTNVSVAFADATFGDAYAGAISNSAASGSATARGISGEAGNDTVEALGNMGVNASAGAVIQGITVALADSSYGDADTLAISRNTAGSDVVARGIDGGDGDDVVTTAGSTAVVGEAFVSVAQLTVSGSGPAYSDARTAATAEVSGIDTGDGDDTVVHGGDFLVAAAPQVGVATRTYGRGGYVDGRVGIDLGADARGISAGAGNDSLTNDGTLLVVVGRQARSKLTGDAAIGTNVVTDSSRIGHSAESIVGKWLRIDQADAPPLFALVESFDPDTGSMTLREPLPAGVPASTGYTLFDTMGGGPDILAGSATVGGRANVEARTAGQAGAAGMSGGDGDDTMTNTGELRVHASNATQAGTITIANNIRANVRTDSNVLAIGMDGDELFSAEATGADVLTNTGLIDVSAMSAIDFGSLSLNYSGRTAVEAGGEAGAASMGMRGAGSNDTIDNTGALSVASLASIGAAQRAFTWFGSIDQELVFAGSASSTGLSGGTGDDTLRTSGAIDVSGTAEASILGATSNVVFFNPFFFITQNRVENVVDVALDSDARGIDAGDGNDSVENAGQLAVTAMAIPRGLGANPASGCPPAPCAASAVSDFTGYSETGASASVLNTAMASGIAGTGGSHDVTNSGDVSVEALAVATSYAQASEVLAADDQSTISAIEAPTVFVDGALAGTEADLAGKQLKLPGSDLGFVRLASDVTAIDGQLGANQFEDTSATELDPARVIGTTIRFPGADTDAFASVVTAFDQGVFTLADSLPVDDQNNPLVAVDDPYTLSVPTTTVTNFDAASGRFELDDALPTGVAAGQAYTVSLVSAEQGPGSATFVDATRIGEPRENLVNSWVRFAQDPDYVAFVNEFDPDTGTFTLDSSIPFALEALEIYELSTVRDGASGSTAIARAAGVDLGGGDARIDNAGVLDVSAIAQARTQVLAIRGAATAAATSQAEALGIHTRDGDDTITNHETGRVQVSAAASTNSSSGTRSATVRAWGIDAGEGANTISNAGSIGVSARLLPEDELAVSVGAVPGDDVGTPVDPFRAEAFGIRTGGGADLVTNGGNLLVVAEGGDPNTDTALLAIGISTGEGDDVVRNLGTLSAFVIDNDVASDGVAIELGDGNDTLHLGAMSMTTGSVALGDGDDVLHLYGNPVIVSVSGELIDPLAGEGIDTLVLHDSGRFDSTPDGFEETGKTGPGAYWLPTLSTMEDLWIEEGELEVDGDYAFSLTGQFRTLVYSDGRHGQFAASGAVSLDGSIEVGRIGESYIVDGTRYELVSASSVTGEFADVTIPGSTPLLRFELATEPQRVDLVAVAEPFDSVASNPLLARIAANLDTIAPGSSGEFRDDLGRLQAMSAGFDRALESYSPDAHQVANEGATRLIQQGTALLQSHLRNSRDLYRQDRPGATMQSSLAVFASSNGYLGVGLGSATALPMPAFGAIPDWAALQGASGQATAAAASGPGGVRSQAWLLGLGSRGDYSAVDGYTAFEQDTGAFGAGYDFRVTDSFLLGIGGGRADTDLEMPDAYASGSVEGSFGNLYASWFGERAYLEGGVTYNRQDFETRRLVEIAGDARIAESTHEGDALSLFAGGGWLFDFGSWRIEPYGTLQYFRLDEDGYAESGAGTLNQVIEARGTEALFGEAGVTLGQLRPAGEGLFGWHLLLGVNHDFDIDERRIDYAYEGSPGNLLRLDGRKLDPTSAILGGAVSYSGERAGFALEYRGRLNSDYDEQSAAATVTVRF